MSAADTQVLGSLLRAGATEQQGAGMLLVDRARQNGFPNARQQQQLSADVSNTVGHRMVRAPTTVVPSPYEWDGNFRARGQMALELDELWVPFFVSLPSELTDEGVALPSLNVSHAYSCELKVIDTTDSTSFLNYSELFEDNSAAYGFDLTADGEVIDVLLVAGGKGYTTAPTVTITGDGSGATATASIFNGRVNSINVTTRGTGYADTTTVVTITGGGGEGAAGRARVRVNGGQSYFADGSLFWRQSIRREGIHRVFAVRPGENEEPTNGLADISVCRIDIEGITEPNAQPDSVIAESYSPGIGWSHGPNYWPAPVRSVGFAGRQALSQAVRLDPTTRQPTERWWVPDGSRIELPVVFFSGGNYPEYFETNPAAGLVVFGLPWPECRGNALYVKYANGGYERTAKIYWKPAEPPRLLNTSYDPSEPTHNFSPKWEWVASMKTLLESTGTTPTGWNLLCNIPLFENPITTVPEFVGKADFVTQPTIGQLVVLSCDVETLNDDLGVVIDAALYPLGTRMPYMLRGKNGMVGGWDGLTSI